MKILVINAYCLTVNSSANLCHIAYIQGLVDAGHSVTVLCSSAHEYEQDKSMILPKEVETVFINGLSLYERLSFKKPQRSNPNLLISDLEIKKRVSLKASITKKVKRAVLSCYGVHGIYSTFVRKAKKLKNQGDFDYIISLSSPAASHLVAYNLMISKTVSCKQWIQIWEDPWYGDIYGFQNKKNIMYEEQRLLEKADKICYVSPLTMKNRQELFTESAHKMYWQPLPYYYKKESSEIKGFEFNQYGYFGDYVPASRDLLPFYEAAKQCMIHVSICGDPCNLFPSTERIIVRPRLPLCELSPIEDASNVLVFLCNRQGGQIPGKIYQYSATNKMILFILDGSQEEKQILKQYFQKFNRYVFCNNTVEDITRAIKVIERGNIGDVVNEPIEEFSPKETVRKILAFENG